MSLKHSGKCLAITSSINLMDLIGVIVIREHQFRRLIIRRNKDADIIFSIRLDSHGDTVLDSLFEGKYALAHRHIWGIILNSSDSQP